MSDYNSPQLITALLERELRRDKRFGDEKWQTLKEAAAVRTDVTLADLAEKQELLDEFIETNPEMKVALRGAIYRVGRLRERMQRDQTGYLLRDDDDFPARVKSMMGKDCPSLLFYRGNLELLNKAGVGILGGKKLSPQGERLTALTASALAAQGVPVISGFTQGTDMIAHTSALSAGGSTIFVPAEGIRATPRTGGIWDMMNEENCLFLSMFAPGAAWQNSYAGQRHILIAALAACSVVMEANASSLTAISASKILEMGAPLFAVDYANPPETATGNPALIEKGAKPLRGRKGMPVLDKVLECVRGE